MRKITPLVARYKFNSNLKFLCATFVYDATFSPLFYFQPLTAALNVYSRGFRSLLKYIKDKYANPEIMIMENGN